MADRNLQRGFPDWKFYSHRPAGFFLIGFLFSIFWCNRLHAQPERVDSLRQLLNGPLHDTARAQVLRNIGYGLSRTGSDSALPYFYRALGTAQDAGWTRGIAMAYMDIGLSEAAKYNYNTADSVYRLALAAYEKSADRQGVAAVHANRSLLHKSRGDYPLALSYAFEALGLLEEINDSTSRAVVLENIGTIYLRQKNHAKTLEYYRQALEIYKAKDDLAGMARNLGNQGIVLNEQGDFAAALAAHRQALRVNEKSGNRHGAQINHANLGITYLNLGEHRKAIGHHLTALAISKKLGDRGSVAVNLGNAGETYYLLAVKSKGADSLVDRSVALLQEAVRICSEINFAGPYVEFTRYLSDALALAGRHSEALEIYKAHAAAEDSLYSEASRLRIAEVEAQRERDLRNRDLQINEQTLEIERLQFINKRNERLIFYLSILVLVIALAAVFRLLWLRTRRHRQTLSNIAHIQSHEVRAPLARILGLVSLIDRENVPDEKEKILAYLRKSAEDLDEVIRKTVRTTSN